MTERVSKFGKKQYTDESVLDAARRRMRITFERHDFVTVSFSGGKDSTACLNLALETARDLGRLPLDVFTFDEEAIPPGTVDYLRRVSAQPDIRFHWYCVPIEHRNACSTFSPYWHPWAPESRELWVRDLPSEAVTDFPGFRRAGIREQEAVLYPPSLGTVAVVAGIRTDESLSRFGAISKRHREGDMAFLSAPIKHIRHAHPIYDWSVDDVWRAPGLLGWDYNEDYDTMERAGISRSAQRCAPPFGEQPIRGLHRFKTCWPELWAKMTRRVPGAATAARYANTPLYGIAIADDDINEGETWRGKVMAIIDGLEPRAKYEVSEAILTCIKVHNTMTGSRPIPDAEPDPQSGYCWQIFMVAAKTGGNKFDRVLQRMANEALDNRKKTGN